MDMFAPTDLKLTGRLVITPSNIEAIRSKF